MAVFSVTVEDEDPVRADADARLLFDELWALDLDRVEFAGNGAAPAGSKGLDAASVTTIVVALAGSPVLRQVAMALRDWVNRDSKRKLVVRDGDRRLEITGPVDAEGQRAVEAFLRKEVEG
ncbi:hypothetical protein [Saccharothrix syringae]|uniref:Uncharacterized protein n=1 Tax=Saccharothrix syringae TaxID=103733 RepID=A0A5Q0HBH2_SACSY|nr:hypothetical protein [Saccharothrix syringae]QFZ23295.1 hypothetical protein EKG83_42895 [Saccharothrix syringae]